MRLGLSSSISWVIVIEMRQSILQVNKSFFVLLFLLLVGTSLCICSISLLQCTNWLFVLYCMVCMYKCSEIWYAIMFSLF